MHPFKMHHNAICENKTYTYKPEHQIGALYGIPLTSFFLVLLFNLLADSLTICRIYCPHQVNEIPNDGLGVIVKFNIPHHSGNRYRRSPL